MHIILNVLADDELLFNVDSCDEGHNIEKIQRMIVCNTTNALLSNFCSNVNNNITINKLRKKRTFQTFTYLTNPSAQVGYDTKSIFKRS